MEGVSTRPDGFFRLSPDAERGEVFAIGRGEAQARLDPAYNHPRYHALNARLNAAAVATPQLGDILKSIASGATPRRADAALYDESESGVNFFRILNIADGEIAETDMKRIARAVHDGQLARSQLADGDVLMTITGRLGSAAAARAEHLPANINQHIVRMKIDAERCRPDFLVEWLNCPIGTELSNRPASGGTRPALDFQAIRRIRVPLPPIGVQDELIALMDAARAERKAKLAEADALLNGVDDFVMDALGIAAPARNPRKAFAVSFAQPRAENRLDSDYYHPERMDALRALNAESGDMGVAKLSEVARFMREQIKSPSDNYLSLAHVQPGTGELADVSDTASGNCFVFRADDVLFARLRPYLNKVHRAERDGCCSTEFHVLRVRNRSALLPEYLAAALRSRLLLSQTVHMMTGNTHPRLTNEDVANLAIPIPSVEIQRTIAAEIIRRRQTARRLRAEAEDGWRSAKLGFENGLLGDGQR